jgi:hypothetical protein
MATSHCAVDASGGPPAVVGGHPGGIAARAALDVLLAMARADLSPHLSGGREPEQLVARVVQLARELIPGADCCGLAIVRPERTVQTVQGGELARACDSMQAGTGEGPAFTVTASAGSLGIPDTETEPRWPRFAAAARAAGIRSLVAIDLPAGPQLRAVLTVYARRACAFGDSVELVLPVFASRASLALARAEDLTNLRQALHSRELVGQAIGILMERHRWTAPTAFEQLVAASQAQHRKLRDIAAELIETGLEPRPQPSAAGYSGSPADGVGST